MTTRFLRKASSWKVCNQHRTPTQGSTTPWKSQVEANGPIGLLLQAVYMVGAKMDTNFRIHQQNETPLDIFATPYQYLGPLCTNIAIRAGTAAREGTRKHNDVLTEIDREATYQRNPDRTREEAGLLKLIQHGGGWDKSSIRLIGGSDDDECEYCDISNHTLYHIIWKCEHFRPQREAICKKLACINPGCLPAPIRIGIAPAMSHRADSTYWGTAIPDSAGQFSHSLGKRSTAGISLQAETTLAAVDSAGANARNLMDYPRGGFGNGTEPAFPSKVDHAPIPPRAHCGASGSM